MKTLRLSMLSLLLAGCAALGGPRAPGDAEFARVQQGMTRDETLRLLGKPFETMRFPLTGNEAWDYLFHDAWGYMAAFSVTFGAQGTVVTKMSRRLNDGGDHSK